MASTYTPLGVELQATGENAGTWGTKTNTNLEIVEQIAGGFTQKSIAGGAQTTALAVSDGATGAELAHRMIEFTGTISGNQIVTIPLDVQTFYFLKNSTSGSHTVQFKYVSGSGDSFTFAATDKGTKIIFASANDGTNPDIIDIGMGDVTLTGSQTLTNKTLTSPTINSPTITSLTATALSLTDSSIVFEGSTADANETTLTVVDPTADRTITLPNETGTLITSTSAATNAFSISIAAALG